MRKPMILFIAVIVLYLSVGVIGCSCQGGQPSTSPTSTPTPVSLSDPQHTVEAFLLANEDLDAEKVVNLLAYGIREALLPILEFQTSLIDDIEISNINIRIVTRSENTATVEAQFDEKVAAFNHVANLQSLLMFQCLKMDSDWLIESWNTVKPTPPPPLWIGISGIAINADIAKEFNLQTTGGILVEQVADDSPAANAGIKGGYFPKSFKGKDYSLGGDIVTRLDGKSISTVADIKAYMYLRQIISGLDVGDPIILTVLRSDIGELTVPVYLSLKPD